MSVELCITSSSIPHWDGSGVQFEIADGGAAILCTVSRTALDEIGGTHSLRTADLLTCFHLHRSRIEAMAVSKAQARPPCVSGRLHLWATDMDDLPPAGIPGAGRIEAFRISA